MPKDTKKCNDRQENTLIPVIIKSFTFVFCFLFFIISTEINNALLKKKNYEYVNSQLSNSLLREKEQLVLLLGN